MAFSISLPKPGALLRQPRQHGSADSLLLAQLKAACTQTLLFIPNPPATAQRLVEEIRFFAPQFSTHLLPDWETLPYDHFSPHPDLISERLTTLYHIAQNACDVIIVPLATALIRLSPKAYLNANTFMLKKGQKLDLEELRRQCAEAGYHHVTQVISHGEFSVRGGLVDLFPTGSALPYRIDLFDDEIETIRTFDVDSQRSLYPVGEIRLLPAREFPLDEAGVSHFRQSFREIFEGDPSKCRLYKDVSNGLAPGGVEWYLPLFFDQTATLFDYLPQDTLLCLHGDPNRAAEAFWNETRSRHRLLDYDRERPILPPDALMMATEDFFKTTHGFARIALNTSLSLPSDDRDENESGTTPIPDIGVDRRAENPLAKLNAFVDGYAGRVLLAAESLGRRETLTQLLTQHGLKPHPCEDWAAFTQAKERLMLGVAPVHAGFMHGDFAIITEGELYTSQVRQQRRREKEKTRSAEGMLKDLAELREHDPVVHEQHGVGRYRGLVNLDFGEGETEFLLLEYAGGDKLYVPVSQLFLISRYSGGPAESAPLHKLGSGQWDKAKKKALKQIRDTAAELLNLYAIRAARQGHAFKLSLHDYETFADGFPFEEKPDQLSAIEAVIQDMQSGRP